MDQTKFRNRLILAIFLLLAGTVGFPFILYGIVQLIGCSRVGGACGAVAVIAGVYLKPLLLLIPFLFLLWAFWRRSAYLGLSRLWTLATLLCLIGSSQFLFSFGNFWGANFTVGILNSHLPTLLMFVVGLSVYFYLYPEDTASAQSVPLADSFYIVMAVGMVGGLLANLSNIVSNPLLAVPIRLLAGGSAGLQIEGAMLKFAYSIEAFFPFQDIWIAVLFLIGIVGTLNVARLDNSSTQTAG